MKSLQYVFQVFNMNNTVSCSIWNGYGKKRTPCYFSLMHTEGSIILFDHSKDYFEFPARVDKMLFTKDKRLFR
jgi:hypothetical protein